MAVWSGSLTFEGVPLRAGGTTNSNLSAAASGYAIYDYDSGSRLGQVGIGYGTNYQFTTSYTYYVEISIETDDYLTYVLTYVSATKTDSSGTTSAFASLTGSSRSVTLSDVAYPVAIAMVVSPWRIYLYVSSEENSTGSVFYIGDLKSSYWDAESAVVTVSGNITSYSTDAIVDEDDTTDSDSSDSDTTDSDSSDSDTTDSDSSDSDTTDSDSSDSDSSGSGNSNSSSGGSSVATTTLVTADPSGYFQSIWDYFGIPAPNTDDWISVKNNETYPTPSNLSSLTETFQVNALPFRAYNLIYKEWFRDENLIDSPEVPKDDGVDDGSIYYLRKRAKRHDYFTSALPWTQKGDEVELPLAIANSLSSSDFSDIDFGSAGGDVQLSDPGSGASVVDSGAGINGDTYIPLLTYDSDGTLIWAYTRSVNDTTGDTTGSVGTNYWNGTIQDGTKLTTPSASITLTAAQQQAMFSGAFDELSIGPISINQLREAFQVQRLLERDARSGTRYTEILRGHFGVVSPDARLQRPEYLGGGTTPISVNTVAQTSSTDNTSPQGNLSAFGVGASRNGSFNKSFVEHGYIIGLVSIRADNDYQQGLNRLWTRQTRYDFYWPVLAHLGEQAVYNYEIYFQNNTEEDETVFGYQERYAEYRYKPNQVTGLFRSMYRETLDFWHLAQDFENCPKLNQEFIEESVPVERVIAVTDEPHFLLDLWIQDVCTRPMPTYSVPGLVDHF